MGTILAGGIAAGIYTTNLPEVSTPSLFTAHPSAYLADILLSLCCTEAELTTRPEVADEASPVVPLYGSCCRCMLMKFSELLCSGGMRIANPQYTIRTAPAAD
jgi:hypothetical protein